MEENKVFDKKVFDKKDIVKEKTTDYLIKTKKDKESRNNWLNNPKNKETIENNPNYLIVMKLPISDKLRNELLNNKTFF